MKKHFIVPFLFFLFVMPLAFAQNHLGGELPFEVRTVYPNNAITKSQLAEAKTLIELDRFLKPSWVKFYISVDVISVQNGKSKTTSFKNDSLTPELRSLIAKADVGADIFVKIQYLPENDLADNDIQRMDFVLRFSPEKEAEFPGGTKALQLYLKEHAIDQIPTGSFQNYDMAAVKFTITDEGQVSDIHLFNEGKEADVNELLVKAVSNMPCWQPAEFDNGLKVKQEKVLIVGSQENCMIPLLNINRLVKE